MGGSVQKTNGDKCNVQGWEKRSEDVGSDQKWEGGGQRTKAGGMKERWWDVTPREKEGCGGGNIERKRVRGEVNK